MVHRNIIAVMMLLVGMSLFMTFGDRVGAAPTRLDDADRHLQQAMELIAAAEAPRTNRGAFDRYRQTALAHVREARNQLRLATQAPFIPPGVLPQR